MAAREMTTGNPRRPVPGGLRIGTVIGAALLAGLVATGCGAPASPGGGGPATQDGVQTQVKRGGTLNLYQRADPVNLDPHLSAGYATTGVAGMTYSRLLKWETGESTDPYSLKPVPDLAESWKQEGDTTYVFQLRKGIKFHNKPPANGREMTSEDVKYSLERQMSKGMPQGWMFDQIAKIETLDRYTVKIVLKEPFAPFLNYIASPYPMVVAKEAVEQFKDLKAENSGTGPFVLGEYNRNVSLVFEKNKEFYLPDRPLVDRVVVNIIPDDSTRLAAFRTKRIDIVDVDSIKKLEALRQSAAGFREWESLGGWLMVLLNLNRDPWKDFRMRQAVNVAVDRDQIIEVLAEGKGTYHGMVTASLGEWTLPQDELKKLHPYDPGKAKQLMAQAGYSSGLKEKLYFRTDTGHFSGQGMAAVLKEQLAKVGIDVELQPLDAGGFYTVRGTSEFGMIIATSTNFSDPDGWLYGSLYPGAERNYVSANDAKLNEMLLGQRRALDLEKRKQIVLEAQRYASANLLTHIPTAGRSNWVAWWPYLRGVHPTAQGWTSNTTDMWQNAWLDK
ncbi:MAG: ABC transporter substrate-binding protein [Chloroflexi bacterium]|nr:ABC transporter substrate-binding protein [Chloroflexota bacterium]